MNLHSAPGGAPTGEKPALGPRKPGPLGTETRLDAVFLPEFHQTRGGAIVSPLLALGWLTAGTSRIKLGTMVLATSLHNPVRLAEDVLMLDHATGGRVILGPGTAHVPVDFELYGRPRGQAGAITD